MKKPIRKLLLALAAAGMVVTQAFVSAGPGTAGPPLVSRTAMKGESVLASFSVVDGCQTTQVGVFGNVSRIKGATANDQLASVAFLQFDTCEGVILLEGFGSTSTLALDVKPNLSRAALEATVTATNFIDGRTFPAVLDLDFAATGKAEKTNTRDKFEFENIVFKTSSNSSERSATASGSLVLDGQEILARGETSFDGFIGSGKERTVTIERRVKP
jgi:hypothetical protein